MAVSLNTAHRRHLVSAYAIACHFLRQMEDACAEGRSPTGVGSPLTPLPQEVSEPVLAPLRELQQELRRRLEELAPRELAAFERPQSADNTRVWLSNLLDRIRVAVDNLQPSRMGRYGAVGDPEATLLATAHAELAGCVAAARAALEADATQT